MFSLAELLFEPPHFAFDERVDAVLGHVNQRGADVQHPGHVPQRPILEQRIAQSSSQDEFDRDAVPPPPLRVAWALAKLAEVRSAILEPLIHRHARGTSDLPAPIRQNEFIGWAVGRPMFFIRAVVRLVHRFPCRRALQTTLGPTAALGPHD